MQTRRKAAQSATHFPSLPNLPTSVQLLILDKAVAQYPVPDTEEYAAAWPHRSSLGLFFTLCKVCTAWNQHLQQHPVMRRRVRLEKLRNLSLLHDFAYYITSSTVSKKHRVNKVPRKVCLHFADGSSSTLDVPKGGVSGAKQPKQPHASSSTASTSGLPTHALMLVTWSHMISSAALLELLADLDTLDQHHAAPMVLQVRNICSDSDDSDDYEVAEDMWESKEEVEKFRCSFAALEAAVLPVVSGALRDVVKEGDSSCAALTFIPTKQGFCRRVPLQ